MPVLVVVVVLVVVLVAALVVALAWYMSGTPRPAATAAQRVVVAEHLDAPLVQLASGGGLKVRSAARAWVRPEVRAALQRAGEVASSYGATLEILDASLEGGGPFPPHLSHQTGRDVDVRYLPSPALEAVLRASGAAKIGVSRDRRDSLRAAGLPASYWPGHTTHAHLRW